MSDRAVGYDNCKFVFIMYVVLWHTVNFVILESSLKSNPNWSPLAIHIVKRYWLWTEKVAVPGFSFLSGFFAKGFLPSILPGTGALYLQKDEDKERHRWEKTVAILFIGPLLLQFTTLCIGHVTTKLWSGVWREFPTTFDVWDDLGTWYLFALLVWRTMTPMIGRLQVSPMVISMFLAVLSAHTNWGYPQEMRRRLFFFFPYYVAGLYCTDDYLDKIKLLPAFMHRFRSSTALEEPKNTNKRNEGRWVGLLGIILTIMVCQVVEDQDTLAWKYSISEWSLVDHSIFFSQFVLAGTSIVSVIMFVRTIPFHLAPFSHRNSTLAIYEWHWSIAGLLGWGTVPFTWGINMMNDKTSSIVIQICQRWSPIHFFMAVHFICYLVCIILGSKHAWIVFRIISEPNCSWLFLQEKGCHIKNKNSEKHIRGRLRLSDIPNGATRVTTDIESQR